MISHKNLIKFARKWQKLAAIRRKRISLQNPMSDDLNEDSCSTSTMADKGHFVVYTIDKKRFMISLEYLKNDILHKLLEAAEEEFGLHRDGPITLPCDGKFLEHALSMMHRHAADDSKKALLMSIASGRCLSSSQLLQEQRNYQLPICSF